MSINENNRPVVKKRKRKHPVLYLVLSVSAILVSIYLLFNVYSEVQTTMELKKQVAEAQAQLEQVQAENDYLITQRDKLNDDDYVQSYARGKYSVSKEGEQVFYLSPTGETATSESTDSESENTEQ